MTLKRTGRILVAFLAAGILFVLVGPRVDRSIEIRPSDLPDLPAPTPSTPETEPWPGADLLEAYVADREARYPDIVPGAEEVILWADPADPRPTEFVVVYLHGYSANRQETAPMADRVAEALGANLFYARLTGHGRSGPAMVDGTVDAWANDGVRSLRIARALGRPGLLDHRRPTRWVPPRRPGGRQACPLWRCR